MEHEKREPSAPGLSPHGQGRAFDFQVVRGGHVIAGVDVSSASQQWDAAGWTGKLRAAVRVAGDHFSGPLKSPYEPWHYAYEPGADASRSKVTERHGFTFTAE